MSNMSEFQDRWTTVLLKDICVRITKGSTPTSYGYNYQDEGIRFIKAENIDSEGIASSTTSYIDDETHEFLKRSILHDDDLLFSIAGTIGRVGRVRQIDLPANTNQALAIIRLKPGVVYQKYLFYYLRSDAIQKESLQKIVGVGRANLSLTNIGEFEIPIAPLEQQKRIVAEIEKQFSRLDEAVAYLKRVKANLKRYKAAVLKAAVEGKLTEEWRKQHLPAPSSVPGKFYTYAILCDDDSIYIGHTDDIERRWKEHRQGQGAEWTQKHKPVKIAHYEEHDTRTEAAEREKWLKTGFGRKWLKRELGAGRTRQAGDVEPADKLLERVLAERREKWQGRGKYKEPAAPDTTDLPELPEGWVWASLGQLIDEPNYGTAKKCDYGSGAVGVLRIPNVANGVIDAVDLKSADFDDGEKSAYALKAGDILTIRSNGSVALVGKCALVRGQDTKFLYAGYLIRMRPSSAEMSSEYLMACLSSQMLRRQIEAKAKSTSGVNNINSGELQSLIVPLCSKKEQNQVVAEVERRLSIVAGAESQVDANLRRADRLRQSILKQAFSGQLVPQDANDEPASLLLERIHSQPVKKTVKRVPNLSSKSLRRGVTVTKLIDALKSAGGWVSAQDAFRLCGVGDGTDTDEIERLYAELRDNVRPGIIEVERRDEEDWLRVSLSKGA